MYETLIVLCAIMILIVFIIIMLGIVLLRKLNNLEESVGILSVDSGKLKKVSVGNYLDITRIKKRLGMNIDEKDSTEGTESKES